MLFLRALLFSIPRFLIIIIALFGIDRFDFSPLPVWTALAVSYAVHFFVTYLFAVWTFGKRAPSASGTVTVCLTFLIWGAVLESAAYLFLMHATFRQLLATYRLQALPVFAMYLIAILLAAWRTKRKNA